MRPSTLLVNVLVCLLASQIYSNLALERIPYLLVFFVFCLAGLGIGLYLALQTNTYIETDMGIQSNVTGPLAQKYISYKIYHEINNITNNLKRNRIDNQKNRDKHAAAGTKSTEDVLRESFERNVSVSKLDRQLSLLDYPSFDDDRNTFYEDSMHFEMDFYNNESKNDASNTKFDSYLDEVVELIVRDYVMTWLSDLIWEKEKFAILVKNELKQSLVNLFKCFRDLDYVKLISRDLVLKFTQHFFEVKRCSNLGEPFKLYSFEMDRNEELKHMRNVIDIIILTLLGDRNYFKNSAIRSLLREILLHKLVMPTIEYFCNPDYINQQVIQHLERRENLRQSLDKKFSYAATYEDFIRIIKTATNLDELRQFHFKIMNEIMQATIINNLKDTKSVVDSQAGAGRDGKKPWIHSAAKLSASTPNLNDDEDDLFDSHSQDSSGSDKNNKANLLRSRDLKAYIKQLKYAKSVCEKRLNNFVSHKINEEERNDIDDFESKIKSRKIYQFNAILRSPAATRLFMQYLEADGSDALLRFYKDVEMLKNSRANAKKQYEIGKRIYDNYLKNYDSPVRDEIGRDSGLIKSMQNFILGNTDEQAFYIAQKKIEKILERDHYHSFVVSDLYENLPDNLDHESRETDDKHKHQTIHSVDSVSTQLGGQGSNDDENDFQNTANKKRIEQLQEKLNKKQLALNAAKISSHKQDDSKIIEALETDIRLIKHEILAHETYLQKTQIWCENMGRWTINALNARLSATNDAQPSDSSEVLYEIQVQLYDHSPSTPSSTTGSPSSRDKRDSLKSSNSADMLDSARNEEPGQYVEGWIIYRTYKQFESLHNVLCDINPYIKNEFKKVINLKPSALTKNTDEAKIKQAINSLDNYLRFICKDPMFPQSQAFYTFFCRNPEVSHERANNSMQNSMTEEKFTISSLFKGSLSKDFYNDDELDKLFADVDMRLSDANAKDSIAEPFYYLLEELFEIKGMKKWFRKSLILFVQLTYGGTINRKIRESINWILSDEMLAYYMKMTRDSLWLLDPNTKEYKLIEEEEPVRLIEEKIRTKNLAKLKLIANIPDALSKLVGERNAQIGVIKLFETFQDEKLNKHLVYSLFELFINYIYIDSLSDSNN